jgi:DNA-binding LytR/AlgR family response regulator
MIDVLIADDEAPALDELEFLLRRDPRIGVIHRANSGAEAIQILNSATVGAAFLDIHMPGLSGFDLARAIRRFAVQPGIVFVTADEDKALEAFDLEATGYLLKPVAERKLERAISRIIGAADAAAPAPVTANETITAMVGSSLRRIRRADVRYVQAQGDYARLHTDQASYLVRIPISDLEQQWSQDGYLRVHRSFLVAIDSVTSLRLGSHPLITVAGVDLPVSRRLLPSVRDALAARSNRPGR